MSALSFDFGQTLCELDHELLARRLAGNHFGQLDAARAARETPAAWLAYGEAKAAGLVGREAWLTFMRDLLTRSALTSHGRSASAEQVERAAQWLWEQQPSHNLWRKPIPGMLELVRHLRDRGVRLGILSNSEGRLRELAEEIGVAELFSVIADSGRLGFEKPDRRIFDYTAQALGVKAEELIHIGDSWEADVLGALNVGARAVWFKPAEPRQLPERVRSCNDARELGAVLAEWGAG